MAKAFSIDMNLSSGFSISVKPLPPYYVDFIDDQFPFPKKPTRKIKLAGGDVVDYEYTPPEEMPDKDDIEEFGLFAKYVKYAEDYKEVSKARERARRDFLLSNCVEIVDGPVNIADEEWMRRLEATFNNFTVPLHSGKRLLAFLKAVVITTPTEYENIIKSSVMQEVTMPGIQAALRGFRSDMG